MDRLTAWLDNPLMMKHVRSRLRRAQVVPSVAVVVILCILIGWAGWMLDAFASGGPFGALLALQTIILVVIGSSMVGAAVGGARASGILDFHRVSPLSPWSVAGGFFLGAPIREYALIAATLPFSLFCVSMGAPDLFGLVQVLVALLVAAWVFHAVALLNGLTTKSPKAGARGIVGLLVFVIMFGGSMATGFRYATDLIAARPKLQFFGVALPWLFFLLLYLVPILGFLLTASTRKMRSERAHALSKPEAVACLATLTVLLLGGLWNVQGFAYVSLVVLYALVGGAIVLTATVTPAAGEYIKAIRRAEKAGLRRPWPWDDLALNRGALIVFCGIVLVGATVAWSAIEGRPGQAGVGVSYSLSIAIGVIVVAYFGLSLQFFLLAFPKQQVAVASMGLFLFVVWLVPLIIGAIVAAAGYGESSATVLFSMSPVVGLALSAGVGERAFGQWPQLAALTPALLFAFAFNNLVAIARRRMERSVHGTCPCEPGFEAHAAAAIES
jgi:hypothetical protein